MHYIFRVLNILYGSVPLKRAHVVDRAHLSKNSIIFAIIEHRRQVEYASTVEIGVNVTVRGATRGLYFRQDVAWSQNRLLTSRSSR